MYLQNENYLEPVVICPIFATLVTSFDFGSFFPFFLEWRIPNFNRKTHTHPGGVLFVVGFQMMNPEEEDLP